MSILALFGRLFTPPAPEVPTSPSPSSPPPVPPPVLPAPVQNSFVVDTGAARPRVSQADAEVIVQDVHGQVRALSGVLNKGGEGRIHALQGKSDALVKVYLPSVLSGARGKRIPDKLEAMCKMDDMRHSHRFGWPQMVVYSARSQCVGYGMRRMAGHQLQTLCQPQLIRERLPHWSRSQMIDCAASFVTLIMEAHSRKVIVGDVNPANFLVDPKSCQVSGIDCDSYQIVDGTEFHPCPVGIPMLLPPELQNVDYQRVRRTVEHELFSVAIMLFRMFMLGLHPYSRTYGEDPVANLKSGRCALGIGSGNRLPKGPWYTIWSHLPGYIKELFIATFRDGHGDPGKRAPLAIWQEALKRYRNDMTKGYFVPHLIPSSPKSSVYKGGNSFRSPDGKKRRTVRKTTTAAAL